MSNKALVVIDIQNDITKHYRDIIETARKTPSAASFLTVPSGLFVFAPVFLRLLGVYVFPDLLHDGGPCRCHKVGRLPQWSVPVDVLFDMRVHLRVLVDLPGGLRLQYADQAGRRDLRRHGYQHMDVVPVCLRRQQLRIEPGAEVADMAFQELRYLIVDDGFSVFCHKDDMVCEQVYAVRAADVFHDTS